MTSAKAWDKSESKVGLGLILAAIMTTLFAGLAGAAGNTQTATGYITVPNSCNFAISNTIVNFGTLNAGTNTIGTGASGVNSVTVTNTGANPANVEIEGTGWSYLSYSFGVSNTVWNGYGANDLWNPRPAASATANVEVQLTGSASDTLLETQNSISQSNTVYLGASVPTAQPGSGAGTYQQTISFVSVC